jgi:hypothetical protein
MRGLRHCLPVAGVPAESGEAACPQAGEA